MIDHPRLAAGLMWSMLTFIVGLAFATGVIYHRIGNTETEQARTEARVDTLVALASDTKEQLAVMSVQLQMLNKQMETQTGGYGQSYAPRQSRFTDNAVEAPQ